MKQPVYLLFLYIFLKARSDNIIDVDDILSERFMPSNLLMLENPENGKFPNTTYDTNFRKRALTGGSLNEAVSTMIFHRSKMNEYLCRNFVAEQILTEMSTSRIRKRVGISEESSKNDIKENMMHDEGSKVYENWLQKSTTLEDIYRHYDTNAKKRNDRHGADKEEEDEEYDSHVIEYTYQQPTTKPSLHDLYSVYGTGDHNEGYGYVPHDISHDGLNSYVGLHANQEVYGGLYDNFHATYGSGNRGLSSIGSFEGHSPSKYHNSGNKEKDLTDLLEIASTALAYLSFGMFIIHVVMCVSSISNNSTTVVTMMPMSMSPSAPEPTAGGMTSAGMTGNGEMTMTGTGGGTMTMTGTGGSTMTMTGTGGGTMTMTGTGDGSMTMTGMGDSGMNGGDMTGGTGGGDTMPGTNQGSDMTSTGAAGTMPDTSQGGDMTSTGGGDTMPDTNQGSDMTMPDQGGGMTGTGGDDTMPGTSQGSDMAMPDQGDGMTETGSTETDQGSDMTNTGGDTATTSNGDDMTGTGNDGSDTNDMTGTGVDGGTDMMNADADGAVTGADGTVTGTGDGGDTIGSTGGDGDGMTGDGGVDGDMSDDGDSMTGTGRSMTGAGIGIDIPQTNDGSMSNTQEGNHINPKGGFYGMTAAEMIQEGDIQDNLNFRFKRSAKTATDNHNYALNELARRILISIEAALISKSDNGMCLKKVLCENNKYSRTVKSRSKIWIPVWSLGMSWLSGKLVQNIAPATSMLDSLKASILGLGNANCQTIYQDCDLNEERKKRRKR